MRAALLSPRSLRRTSSWSSPGRTQPVFTGVRRSTFEAAPAAGPTTTGCSQAARRFGDIGPSSKGRQLPGNEDRDPVDAGLRTYTSLGEHANRPWGCRPDSSVEGSFPHAATPARPQALVAPMSKGSPRRDHVRPGGKRALDADSRRWVEQLRAGHPRHHQTVARLNDVLRRVAVHELSRRRRQLR